MALSVRLKVEISPYPVIHWKSRWKSHLSATRFKENTIFFSQHKCVVNFVESISCVVMWRQVVKRVSSIDWCNRDKSVLLTDVVVYRSSSPTHHLSHHFQSRCRCRSHFGIVLLYTLPNSLHMNKRTKERTNDWMNEPSRPIHKKWNSFVLLVDFITNVTWSVANFFMTWGQSTVIIIRLILNAMTQMDRKCTSYLYVKFCGLYTSSKKKQRDQNAHCTTALLLICSLHSIQTPLKIVQMYAYNIDNITTINKSTHRYVAVNANQKQQINGTRSGCKGNKKRINSQNMKTSTIFLLYAWMIFAGDFFYLV